MYIQVLLPMDNSKICISRYSLPWTTRRYFFQVFPSMTTGRYVYPGIPCHGQPQDMYIQVFFAMANSKICISWFSMPWAIRRYVLTYLRVVHGKEYNGIIRLFRRSYGMPTLCDLIFKYELTYHQWCLQMPKVTNSRTDTLDQLR